MQKGSNAILDTKGFSLQITCITVFDPTNASIFFQSRSKLHRIEGTKQCKDNAKRKNQTPAPENY